MVRRRLTALLPLLGCAAIPAVAAAQAQTTIVADTDNAMATGTRVAGVGTRFEIGGGTVVESNVFHSFSAFDLAAGDTASWNAPAQGTIANIINRVTGGSASRIAGTIDTTAMPQADFYFINPAGVILGEGVRLDIGGASHFSTASHIGFANGDVFSARTPDGSTFSMSSPESFGFLGGEAALLIDGAEIGSADGGTVSGLSIVGSDVTVSNSTLRAQGLEIVAAGEAQELRIGDPFAEPLTGNLEIETSTISAAPGNRGDRALRFAGETVLVSRSDLSSAAAEEAGPNIEIAGTDVTVFASTLTASTGGSAAGGSILIAAGEALSVLEDSQLLSSSEGSGQGGEIALLSNGSLQVTGTVVTSEALGAGDGGQISLTAGSAIFLSGSEFLSASAAGGDGGDLLVSSAGGVAISGSGLLAVAFGEGDGGTLSIAALGPIDATQSVIATTTQGAGDGGLLTIGSQGSVLLEDTVVLVTTSAAGDAGNALVSGTESVTIAGGGISGTSFAEEGGDAGSIAVLSEGDIALSDTEILADSYGTGRGGNVRIDAQNRLEVIGALVVSRVLSEGSATGGGSVDLRGGTGLAVDGSQFSTETTGAANGGSILIGTAGDLELSGSTVASSTYGGEGDGGSIRIFADGATEISATTVTADTYGAGWGGFIDIDAGTDISVSGGSISAGSARAEATGDGGLITLDAAGSISLDNAGIATNILGSGRGGDVRITAGEAIDVTGASSITAGALGSGDAGIVNLITGALLVSDSEIASRTVAAGDANGVLLEFDTAILAGDTLVASETSGSGSAGLVYLGGNISEGVPASELTVTNGAEVTARSTGPGRAGNVLVEALDVTVSEEARISAEALGEGSAGFVQVSAAELSVLEGGRIETSSATGTAGLIAVDLGFAGDEGGILRLRGDRLPAQIRTDSAAGSQASGGIVIIENAAAVISDGSEISASGDVSNAVVLINDDAVRINASDSLNLVNVDGYNIVAPEQDVSRDTFVLDVPYLDASEVLARRCRNRGEDGRDSRLDVIETGPFSAIESDTSEILVARTTPGGCG